MTTVVGFFDKQGVEWLNYHHLYYFSVIAREGGLAPAARALKLTHSTLSSQLRTLEAQLGSPLFERRGKRLVLTAFGAEATRYADEIFRTGRALMDVAKGRARPGGEELRVGVVPGLPKGIVQYLLSPLFDGPSPPRLVVTQDGAGALLEALGSGRLHTILSHEVPTIPAGIRARTHALGETEVWLYGPAAMARRARPAFPASIDGLPFVLPPSGAPLRRQLDAWFAEVGVRVDVRVVSDDAGVVRAFGRAGRGVYPVRSGLRSPVDEVDGVAPLGRCEGLRERYYAVTIDRELRHPALKKMVAHARAELVPTQRKTTPRGR